jgi:hypothetical protein
MVTLALRIGNHDFGFEGADPSGLLRVLITVCVFAVLGTVIGLIFRRSVLLQVIISVAISCAIIWYSLARAGMLSSRFTSSEKIEGLYELSGFYLLFCIAPAVLASVFLARRLIRRKTI